MDKTENLVGNYSHSVNLVERKNMIITGVKKIENFDSEEFFTWNKYGIFSNKGNGFRTC